MVVFSELESLIEHGIPEIARAIVTAADENGNRGKQLTAFCQLQKEHRGALDEK
jgi:hypothetical protein